MITATATNTTTIAVIGTASEDVVATDELEAC